MKKKKSITKFIKYYYYISTTYSVDTVTQVLQERKRGKLLELFVHEPRLLDLYIKKY